MWKWVEAATVPRFSQMGVDDRQKAQLDSWAGPRPSSIICTNLGNPRYRGGGERTEKREYGAKKETLPEPNRPIARVVLLKKIGH